MFDIEHIEVQFMGERVILFKLGSAISEITSQKVRRLARAIAKNTAVGRVVPTFTDVAVVSSTLAADWTLDQWRELLGVLRFDEDDDTPKHVHLTVDFYSDGEGDMTTFAHQIGMEVDDSIKALCSCQFTVGMIGFLPGMPYLSGLPASLHLPRRSQLATAEAGTFAIGGQQAGVLTRQTLTGWWRLGHTETIFFDQHADPMAILSIGDKVTLSRKP